LPERSNRTFHLLALRLPRQPVVHVAPVSDRVQFSVQAERISLNTKRLRADDA
jgi:hypothetical protein